MIWLVKSDIKQDEAPVWRHNDWERYRGAHVSDWIGSIDENDMRPVGGCFVLVLCIYLQPAGNDCGGRRAALNARVLEMALSMALMAFFARLEASRIEGRKPAGLVEGQGKSWYI